MKIRWSYHAAYPMLRILSFSVCLWLGSTIPVHAQVDMVSAENNDATEEIPSDITLRVAVEEVRLDAVVVDKNGNQIPDLTADDFEVYQDGKRQIINSCKYIADYQGEGQESGILWDSSELARLPSAPMPQKDEIRRTIVFLVDDLAMSFQHLNYARMALQTFVESQMESGDLVAILRTSAEASNLRLFSSDRRALLHMVENLHWGANAICGSNGCGQYDEGSGEVVSIEPSRPDTEALASLFEKRRLFGAQMASILYSIRALQDLPGRKFLILMSSKTTYTAESPIPANFWVDDGAMVEQFNAVADEALRAGVVIHTLDTKGLSPDSINAYSPYENYLPYSKKTGGILIDNSNFFMDGLGPVEQQLKGFYLLAYTPPENTFNQERKRKYHKVKIRVKRRGSRVHTRDGFYGVSKSLNLASAPERDSLQEAIFSPFLHNDLNLSLKSGYAHTPNTGYFLRSWLHIDAKNLVFRDEKDGRSVSLELVILTADSYGNIRDSQGRQYRYRLTDEDYAWALREGIDFEAYLPVQTPGGYYVRAAVRDSLSGKIGSSYQFLEVPDLQKLRLSLSSIFILNRGEDVSAIQMGDESVHSSSPARQYQAIKSPALRSYLPGEGFDYAAMVYKAKNKKKPEAKLQSQFTLFKDGKEYFKGKTEEISQPGMEKLGGIPIAKSLFFNNEMDPGFYVLQLTVTDSENRKKSDAAVQTLDFTIRRKKEAGLSPDQMSQ